MRLSLDILTAVTHPPPDYALGSQNFDKILCENVKNFQKKWSRFEIFKNFLLGFCFAGFWKISKNFHRDFVEKFSAQKSFGPTSRPEDLRKKNHKKGVTHFNSFEVW